MGTRVLNPKPGTYLSRNNPSTPKPSIARSLLYAFVKSCKPWTVLLTIAARGGRLLATFREQGVEGFRGFSTKLSPQTLDLTYLNPTTFPSNPKKGT